MNTAQMIPQAPTQPGDQAERDERRAVRGERRKQQRIARLLLYGTLSGTVVLLGLMGFVYLQISNMVNLNTLYPPVNGVPCASGMSIKYHIHVHVSIYVNGKSVTIPQGIGIGANNVCYYFLHTHTSDGIVHVEAPARASNLALDDFLSIWYQRFSKLNFPQQLTQQSGWTIYLNGKRFPVVVTSPLTTEVPLSPHDVVTLDYGSHNPPPDKSYVFPPGL